MYEIVPLTYENNQITVLTDSPDNSWWVAKEVCDALNIKWNGNRTLSFLDNDEKIIQTLQTPGGPQETYLVSESGLYTLIMRSNKEKARKFRKWITSEVIPTIRKTGSYSVKNYSVPEEKRIQFYLEEFDTLVKFAERFNITGNQALLAASKGCISFYGVDPMNAMDLKSINCETQSIDVTPTEIGKELKLSAMAVNKLLTASGYQTRTASDKYEPTEKGAPYAVIKDTSKKHSNGTPVTQLLWKYMIVDVLREAVKYIN